MLVSVYLSDDVKDILSCYGNLNDVVNKILEAGAQGVIDIMCKPTAPDKTGGHYYAIYVKEPNYIELIETYGTKSSKVSLRRLLYWFVENEIYAELGWEPNEIFVNTTDNKSYDALMELKNVLYKTSKHFPAHKTEFDQFKNLLNTIEEEIWNA